MAKAQHEQECHRTVVSAVNDVIPVFVKAGAYGGSRTHLTLAEHYADGLGRFKAFLLEKWQAYLKPRVPLLTAEQQDAVKAAVVAAFNAALADFSDALLNLSPKPEYHRPFRDTAARLLAGLEAEIGIDMSTPPSGPTVHQTVTNTTHGNNSPINSGSGTQMQAVHTNASPTDLAVALGLLIAQIRAAQAAGTPALDDALRAVEDAKKEAEEAEPRFGRIGILLRGAKPFLETIALTKPAFEAVVAIAAAIGFHI
ncbi:hypothetical protein FHP25_25095 [Vineibacter terrae]|uniref:Uncharacterized protein n=1 Tax=Vineibacter terrae TaxID=2586908 RepID=A0A5C8PG23_9HYPH|nr:hypothetical protein [Vineibacter terrae]TXL72576.1 hypothetical protein FHP25_25095 [Vineibacter terrae]